MNVHQFFTDQEKSQIREAVRRAESKTSGEIVPMVVEHSADYTTTRLTAAILGALVGAGLWLLVQPFPHPLWIIAAQAIGFLAVLVLLRIKPGMIRFLMDEAVIEAAIRQRAQMAFFEHGLYQTQDRTGVLIMISLLERRVQILADQGINQRVPQSVWSDLVQHLIGGIHQGKTAVVLCEVIERCGQILAQHFPRRSDDRDELSNKVITS
jgi:putative membrane protein